MAEPPPERADRANVAGGGGKALSAAVSPLCTFLSLQDPVAQLPADMVARGYSIFSIILKYAVDMLTWDQEDQLPAGLEPT